MFYYYRLDSFCAEFYVYLYLFRHSKDFVNNDYVLRAPSFDKDVVNALYLTTCVSLMLAVLFTQ